MFMYFFFIATRKIILLYAQVGRTLYFFITQFIFYVFNDLIRLKYK